MMRARVVLGFSLLSALVAAPLSVATAQQARPSLNAGRITGELVAGTYAGIGGFLVGRYVGERMGDLAGVDQDHTRRLVGNVTGVAVAGLATAGTVYAIGNIGDQTGQFDATYLGTGVGFVAGWALSRALLGPQERPRQGMSTAMRWATVNIIAFLPSIGATVGFNSSRRFR
jgi:hypothetical protein